MGKFPVTNREYACFLRAAGYGIPHLECATLESS